MTARQMGRRIDSIASQRRRQQKSKPARGRRAARKAPLHLREKWRLLQGVISGLAFVLLVGVKLLFPAGMAEVSRKLSAAMERNIDVRAVFSAVGDAFSGQDAPGETVEEVYRAVFYPMRKESTASVLVEGGNALQELQKYRADISEPAEAGEPAPEPEPQPEASTLAYVLYSDQNLPENVSLEQAVLNFTHCTPVAGTLSSNFGYREHPVEGEDRFHYGVDLAANTGTDIACFADGTVSAVGESSSYGKYCIVRHAGDYTTLYAHCSRVIVSSGAEVKQGQKLAEVGESGMATGPHLHFELCHDGVYLNPIYYVKTA